jgi:hypothetical protein
MTRFTTASLALLATIILATAPLAAERHSKINIVPVGGSGVTGFVQLDQSSPGSTSFHMMAKGLRRGTDYAVFSGSGDCSARGDLLGNLSGNKGGVDQFQGDINLDLSGIGSVSIRLGPGFGTLVACGTLTVENLAPTVSSTVPANAATGVAINANLTAAFSEAMDPLTITTASFTLRQGVTPIAGTVSYTGVTATFAPAGNLAPLTTYTATITTAARNLAGNALATNFVWSFTTGVTPDIIAPTVSSTVPVNAATGVSINGKLTAAFSEAMDPLTITTTSFTLKHGTIGVAGGVTYTGVTATFTAAGPLQPLTVYTATISTAAKDLAGNALVTNYSWTFTTGAIPGRHRPHRDCHRSGQRSDRCGHQWEADRRLQRGDGSAHDQHHQLHPEARRDADRRHGELHRCHRDIHANRQSGAADGPTRRRSPPPPRTWPATRWSRTSTGASPPVRARTSPHRP